MKSRVFGRGWLLGCQHDCVVGLQAQGFANQSASGELGPRTPRVIDSVSDPSVGHVHIPDRSRCFMRRCFLLANIWKHNGPYEWRCIAMTIPSGAFVNDHAPVVAANVMQRVELENRKQDQDGSFVSMHSVVGGFGLNPQKGNAMPDAVEAPWGTAARAAVSFENIRRPKSIGERGAEWQEAAKGLEQAQTVGKRI